MFLNGRLYFAVIRILNSHASILIFSEIMEESFFLINIQTLCETEEGDFLPCEIACLEFSLAKGIIKTFHKFIDPGKK